MTRLLLILGIVGALAAPVSAQASTTRTTIAFDDTFPLCNGDPVHLTGPLLITTTETATPSGGHLLAVAQHPEGVTGVDLVTGAVFHGGGLNREATVTSPSGGSTESFVLVFHLQATKGGQSFLINELFHVTVTPDGAVRVSFDKLSATC